LQLPSSKHHQYSKILERYGYNKYFGYFNLDIFIEESKTMENASTKLTRSDSYVD
jgi:hypothetical protein